MKQHKEILKNAKNLNGRILAGTKYKKEPTLQKDRTAGSSFTTKGK